jgi:hypothetical protein
MIARAQNTFNEAITRGGMISFRLLPLLVFLPLLFSSAVALYFCGERVCYDVRTVRLKLTARDARLKPRNTLHNTLPLRRFLE